MQDDVGLGQDLTVGSAQQGAGPWRDAGSGAERDVEARIPERGEVGDLQRGVAVLDEQAGTPALR